MINIWDLEFDVSKMTYDSTHGRQCAVSVCCILCVSLIAAMIIFVLKSTVVFETFNHVYDEN